MPLLVFGEGVADKQVSSSVYLFHLYYDNSQLFADRDVQFKYDILSEIFVSETINTQFPYRGEVISLRGEVVQIFQFDPRQGNPNFLKGKISVKAPYFADGQKVNFYDGQGNQLLSVFVSDSSFCNDDGACNADVGEDDKTCPIDCKTTTPIPTFPIDPSASDMGMIKVLVYIIIGLGVIAGGWYGRKWWKSKQGSSSVEFPINMPPQPPINQ